MMIDFNNKENFCLIFHGDSREVIKMLPYKIDLIITSPPYADARKNHYESIHPDDYANWFLSFHEPFWNILKLEGNFVLNIKDKIVDGTRHRFVWDTILKLGQNGWLSIEDYIWHKPNPMPGYWPTRLRDGWEYCFHLAKIKKPFMNQESVKIPVGDWVKSRLQNLSSKDTSRHNSANKSGFGRNISNWKDKTEVLPYNVLTVPVVGTNKGHPAVFPIELPAFFIKLLTESKAIVLDPFGGSGTSGIAALQLGRDCILIDNNLDYCQKAYERIFSKVSSLFVDLILINDEGVIIASNTEELIGDNIYSINRKFSIA